MTAETPSPAADRSRDRLAIAVTLVVAAAAAAVVGAYLDWLWWPVYAGLTITLTALALLLVGVVVSLIRRRTIRRTGFVILAVAVGLLLGQNLGPTREPLIYQPGGTITLRLDGPVPGTASGPVDCTNVPSGAEFQVSGDPNLRLDTDRSFVSISIHKGDRWTVLGDRPESGGVQLLITVSPESVPEGKPSEIGMEATQQSTVEATFSNEGGHLEFSGLEPVSGPDHSGDSIDLAGTIDWTCGEIFLPG